MFKFALNINNEDQLLTPKNGLPFGELGVLINHLDKAINPKDGKPCVLYSIENHGYTPNFLTESELLYNKFIDVHKNIQERELTELNKEEATYASTLKKILSTDKYVEPIGNDDQPLFRLSGKEIERGVENYSIVTNQSGIISEIGSPKLDEVRHVYLHDVEYKIFITPQQEELLKKYYRDGVVDFKVKQKRSIKSGRIISATLISFKIKPDLTISESLSTLSQEDLSFVDKIETADDILILLRS